jgi:hypothetical protein
VTIFSLGIEAGLRAINPNKKQTCIADNGLTLHSPRRGMPTASTSATNEAIAIREGYVRYV